MKKKYSLFLILVSAFFFQASAQTVFWTENFNNGCSSLCTSYTGVNGAWTFQNNGPAMACGGSTTPNLWYISCAENGFPAGTCGNACSTNNATLHVGNDPNSPSAALFCPTGDCGAAYDAGGYCALLSTPPSTVTDIMAQSPAINCSGRTSITISFNYLEFGQGTIDDATLWYYDGSSWSQIDPLAKTVCCGGNCNGNRQGQWTAFSMLLPTSANNNSNVKIGFRWVNDDDGTGTDPSFAVDDVKLSVPASNLPNAIFSTSDSIFCEEPTHCINFTDHSTGNPSSWQWYFPGGSPDTSSMQNPDSICYPNAGTYSVTLIVTNSNGSDTLTISPKITVGNFPMQPTITLNGGDTLISSHAFSYQWFYNGSLIPGATDSIYIAHNSGFYSVQITDSIGCSSISTFFGIGTSINDLINESGIIIYPNPVKDEFTISCSQSINITSIEVFNVLGDKILTKIIEIYGFKELAKVDFSKQSAGVYFVQIKDGTKIYRTMIVK